MTRRLLNLLTALSLLVAVAGTALWVRSHFAGDSVRWARFHGGVPPGYDVLTSLSVSWRSGGLMVGAERVPAVFASADADPEAAGFSYRRWDDLGYPRLASVGSAAAFVGAGGWYGRRGPFEVQGIDIGHSVGREWLYRAVVPLWALALAGLPLPLARLARWRRRRHAAHACRHCGYDLTGNVSGVCPECGKARIG